MKTGPCMFCYGDGKPRVLAKDQPEVGEDTFVCASCWTLLQNPTTALPLMRGHLALTERGKVPEAQLKDRIDKFMKTVLPWKKRN